jgi:hypothetical protein
VKIVCLPVAGIGSKSTGYNIGGRPATQYQHPFFIVLNPLLLKTSGGSGLA